MPEETVSIPISLRVPREVVKTFDQIAAAVERPRSWVMLRALRQYIADEGQEVLDVQEGIDELERGDIVPIEDVLAEAHISTCVHWDVGCSGSTNRMMTSRLSAVERCWLVSIRQ